MLPVRRRDCLPPNIRGRSSGTFRLTPRQFYPDGTSKEPKNEPKSIPWSEFYRIRQTGMSGNYRPHLGHSRASGSAGNVSNDL